MTRRDDLFSPDRLRAKWSTEQNEAADAAAAPRAPAPAVDLVRALREELRTRYKKRHVGLEVLLARLSDLVDARYTPADSADAADVAGSAASADEASEPLDPAKLDVEIEELLAQIEDIVAALDLVAK